MGSDLGEGVLFYAIGGLAYCHLQSALLSALLSHTIRAPTRLKPPQPQTFFSWYRQLCILMAATQEQEPSWPELLGSKNWDSLLDPLNLSLRKLILRCGDFCQATYDAFNNDENSKYCGSSRYGKLSFFDKVMLEFASDYRVDLFLYATSRISLPQAILLHSRSRESWDRESNWIGYIASTSDEKSKDLGRREVYVVWRGTTRDYEWIDVLDAKLEPAKPLLRVEENTNNQKDGSRSFFSLIDNSSSSSDCDDDENENKPKVMLGWLTVYTSDDPKSSFTKLSARAQLLGKIK